MISSYFANTTCGAAYEYKLKMFNQAYCFDTIYGTPYPGGAKYNCDGTVTSYTNNTCQKQSPPRSTKVCTRACICNHHYFIDIEFHPFSPDPFW